MVVLASSDVLNCIHFIYNFFLFFTNFNLCNFFILLIVYSLHTHSINMSYLEIQMHRLFPEVFLPSSARPIRTQYRVITDFVQTFQRDYGLTTRSWCDIINNPNSIFDGFSNLIEHLFALIDSDIPSQSFTIKGLNTTQRRDFYIELSNIGINYSTNQNYHDNGNQSTDICINTINMWSVPDYRTTPELAIYQYSQHRFDSFYSGLTLISRINTQVPYSLLMVSLENFLEFKRIFIDAHSLISYNSHIINNIIIYDNNPISATTTAVPDANSIPHATAATAVQSKNYSSDLLTNNKIKLQLADLIFDIKDNLSDAMYKDILDKIALISP